jgi:hypothetical protein
MLCGPQPHLTSLYKHCNTNHPLTLHFPLSSLLYRPTFTSTHLCTHNDHIQYIYTALTTSQRSAVHSHPSRHSTNTATLTAPSLATSLCAVCYTDRHLPAHIYAEPGSVVICKLNRLVWWYIKWNGQCGDIWTEPSSVVIFKLSRLVWWYVNWTG